MLRVRLSPPYPVTVALPHSVDWPTALRLHARGASIRGIADRFGVTYSAVHKGLARYGKRRVAGHRPHHARLYAAWSQARRLARESAGGRLHCAWRGFDEFYAWALATGYRPGLALRMLKPARGLTPGNCRWLTRSELAYATAPPRVPAPRRVVAAFGERKGLTEWTRDPRCKVGVRALRGRLRRGMRPEAAMSTLPRANGPRPGRMLTAFGVRKSIAGWARDRRCEVTLTTLAARVRRGVPIEVAIRRDGVRRAVGARVRAGVSPRR